MIGLVPITNGNSLIEMIIKNDHTYKIVYLLFYNLKFKIVVRVFVFFFINPCFHFGHFLTNIPNSYFIMSMSSYHFFYLTLGGFGFFRVYYSLLVALFSSCLPFTFACLHSNLFLFFSHLIYISLLILHNLLPWSLPS